MGFRFQKRIKALTPMNKYGQTTFLAISSALAGCMATTPVHPPTFDISTSFFDEAKARIAIAPGANTIKGSAFFRQRGGGLVTCAGQDVVLVPDTPYAARRMEIIYGSFQGGNTGGVARPDWSVEITPDLPLYKSLTRRTTCNVHGEFRFDNVADGRFYVTTGVFWRVGQDLQGGRLMKIVDVKGGITVEPVLTD